MEKTGVKIVREGIPFLVKGLSRITNENVLGYPYVHVVEKDGETKYLNIILVPEEHGINAFSQHPIEGPMYKFSRIDENGEAVFEDECAEKDIVAEAKRLSDALGDVSDELKKAIMLSFMQGVKWGAVHGITINNFRENDKE